MLKPLAGKVLVRQLSETKQIGSFVLVGQKGMRTRRKDAVGVVLSSGDGVSLTPGQEVVYASYSGRRFSHENEKFVLLNSSEIMGLNNA